MKIELRSLEVKIKIERVKDKFEEFEIEMLEQKQKIKWQY